MYGWRGAVSKFQKERERRERERDTVNMSTTARRSLRQLISETDAKILNRFGVTKASELIDTRAFLLKDTLDASEEEIRRIRNTVFENVCPKPNTALELLKRRGRYVRTGFKEIDRALCGGIPSGSVSEISGKSGIGKSQFCFTIASEVLSRSEENNHKSGSCSVVYIDTEMKFSPPRVREIVQGRSEGLLGDKVMSRLHVFSPKNSKELVSVLRSLESYIIEFNVSIVILDSMAFHVLREFSISQIARRQALLGSLASILKWIAETFQIPVLVTNHALMNSESESLRAALGTAWSHCVNTRFVMREITNNIRVLRIEKSPIAPPLSAEYSIGSLGVIPQRSSTTAAANDNIKLL